MNTKALQSDLLLLLTAAIWGFAFVAQIVGMEHMGPFYFNASRFTLGFLSLLPVYYFLERRKKHNVPGEYNNKALLIWGPVAGLMLFGASSLQQVGLLYTTAGNAGFITGFYLILVPIIGIWLGHTTRPATWVGAALAFAGLYFLTVREGLASTINKGDLLTLGSAGFYAVQILLIGWLSRQVHPLRLSLLQFLVCAVLSMIVAIGFETISLEALQASLVPLLYTGIMSTSVAFTFQIIAQKNAPSSHAAIIMSLEAVFAVIGGWLLLDESMGSRGTLGCTLMMAGMLLSQLRRSKKSSPS